MRERLGRGLYRMGAADPDPWASLALASLRVPHGVVGLLSALAFHDLGDELPQEVWMLIGRHDWRPRGGQPPLRLVHASPTALDFGTETRLIEGVAVRMTSPAKTVADAFKYRRLLGLDVALAALRDYRRQGGSIGTLLEAAQVCRAARVMQPYLEALWGGAG